MIHELLPIVASDLNEYFKFQFDTNEDKVVLSHLVDTDGSFAVKEENKVIMSLVNIEKDAAQGSPMRRNISVNPPITLNLYVLFVAHFKSNNHIEALKFLSGIIGFFQAKTIFDHRNTPLLPEYFSKIYVEMVSMNMDDIGKLWGALGAKYTPSVMYRLRSITIQEGRIRAIIPEIAALDVGGLDTED